MSNQIQEYSEYRPTGILWAPLAPSHWRTVRMDALATMIRDQITPADMHGYSVVHYSIPNVQETGGALLEDGSTIASSKFKVELDDVLYSKLNPRKETIAVVEEHEGLVVASSEFVVLRPSGHDHDYLQYLLRVPGFKGFVCAQVESATRSHQRINPSVVSKLIFAAPPIEERNGITKFLDYETAKVDALIEKQQQLIALLKEKRQAVISHAVTKGLNPDAPMRDSGVGWLGEIPAHWSAAKLKHHTRQIVDGAHFTPTYVDEGVPFLRVTDIQTFPIDQATVKFIPEAEHQELVKRCLPERGDLLLSKNGTIGVPRTIDWDWGFSIFVSLCLIKLKESLDVRFLFYYFLTHQIREQIFGLIKQSTVINLHLDKIENFWLAVPTLDEQKAVVEYLDGTVGKYDLQIEHAKALNDLLQERRTALISVAVTGKVDVRDWKAPKSETQAEVA